MLSTARSFVDGRQIAEVPCVGGLSGQKKVQHGRHMYQHGRNGLHTQLTNRTLSSDCIITSRLEIPLATLFAGELKNHISLLGLILHSKDDITGRQGLFDYFFDRKHLHVSSVTVSS